MSRPLDVPTHVSYRYLLVELPLMGDVEGFDPDEEFYRIRNDVSEFLWEDSALAEPPTVVLVYPGDVVPGGVDDNRVDPWTCPSCGRQNGDAEDAAEGIRSAEVCPPCGYVRNHGGETDD